MCRWQIFLGCCWILCLLFVVPGCESVGTLDPQQQPRRSVYADRWEISESETLNILSYYRWIQQCNGDERQREYERLSSGLEPEEALRSQLQLSLLLSLPDTPFRDDHRAQALLQAYLNSGNLNREDDTAFAMFLLDVLKERERQKVVVGQLQDRIKDYRYVQDELSKERAIRHKLEKQMKQLKAIEENLIKREHADVKPHQEGDSQDGKSQDSSGR